MNLVKRKVFAVLCNCTVGIVNTNISRGSVVAYVNDMSRIDADNPINKRFAKDRKALDLSRAVSEKPKTKVVTTRNPSNAAERRELKRQNKQAQAVVDAKYSKILADAKRANVETSIKQYQLARLKGRLLPVDLTADILKINIQTIFINFENELVNIASIYCDILAAGDRSKLSEIIELMRQNLSRIIKNTKADAGKNLKTASFQLIYTL